ncbi:UDP-N-acetyl-D-glucosamine dehydrogenase [Alkalihalobacillus xiaoxiensis]|uniref:UDP-N-acetyl-D-glucosamine dehydrogenase n=1 Tax=Shouchella xiaoxiensis TaxID=766895 RepID=A0ABS2SXU1_9BACI|nr:UDP-N-acetyl-D-glucosamine dehydrogenase [Shouchella xiaoxiensis]
MNPKVAIIGLGYVGLPLAMLFAAKGYQVFGIDHDHKKVQMLEAGLSYLMEVSNEEIQTLTNSAFSVSTTYQAINEVDSIILCVPTPLSESQLPNLSYVQTAIHDLIPFMKENQLVVLESSTYPGSTEEVVVPLFKRAGFIAGKSIAIGYSPERIDPGNAHYRLENIPKVISGVTSSCTEKIINLYKPIFSQLVPVSSPKVAEMAKMLENAQRFVNLTFMNEMARVCHELDLNIWEVIEATETKPYGYFPCKPGPGVGGHCIPVDPLYLKWKANQAGCLTEFIDLAKKINDDQPSYLVERIKALLPPEQGSTVLLLGLTYKGDSNDLRESVGPILAKTLVDEGFIVDVYDPFVEEVNLGTVTIKSTPFTTSSLRKYDLVVLVTDHSSFPYEEIASESKLVFDTRNCFKNGVSHIHKL